MSRVWIAGLALLVLAGGLAGPAPAATAKMTAAEIVDRNVVARGGLAAWHAVQALSWSGKMDAGGNNQRYLKAPGLPEPPPAKDPEAQVQLPFTLEMQRGRKSRLEIVFNGQTAVQVFDGKQGWKLRPFLNRKDVEPFTTDEMKASANQSEFDGMLIDYASKGTRVELEGIENVEGNEAYKLKLTLSGGATVHDWVDAKSFLELKVEGTPRRLDGRLHAVSVYLRDYRAVGGLQIPHLIETAVQGVQRTEKIQLDKVTVNPKLDAARFAKPAA
jgi:hypothetical protein